MSKTEMTLNPKFTDMELGKSFSGTCIRCNKEEDKVRILLNQSDEKSGPYDRLCAYELKMGSVPPFTTFPRNLKEKIYRFTTKSEIPSDDKIINRAFVRILIILGLELIGYLLLPGSLLLVMIELFTNLKLIRISSPFVITILLLNVISMVYITLQISEIQLDHPDKSGIRKRIDKIEQIPKKIDNNLYENVTWKEFFKTSFIYFFYLNLSSSSVLLGGGVAISFIIFIFYMIFYLFLYILPFYVLLSISRIFSSVKPRKNVRNLDTTLFPDFEHIKFGLFNNKKLGGNYIENFENFWSGDINVVLKNKWVYRRYDLKLVLVFGLDVIIIKLIQKFLSTYTDFHNSVSSFINSLYYYKYLINYVTIEPITFFMICFTIVLIAMTGLYDILFGMIFILLPKFSSTLSVPPKDVQLRVIERYLKGETVIKEQPQVSFVERITRIFRRDSNFENWKIICPICLNDVKGSKVSQCENCSRLFHTDHLNLYMTEFANSGKIPLCPICKTNLNKSAIDAVFS